MAETQKTQHWGSRLGVILAVAGSAVGLGNFIRFPGQAAQNGGGAFMIPYLVALVLLALPIAWGEWSMARYGGRKGFRSGPAILGVIGKGRWARYGGVLSVLIPGCIYLYYVYIESWCLRYAWEFLTGGMDLGGDPTQHAANASALFGGFVGMQEDGFGSAGSGLVFFAICLVINISLVYRGLSRGIEKFCTYALPAMAIIAVIVLVRALTLPAQDGRTVVDGLAFMWNPDFQALKEPKTWMAAASQIFFSLSIGFGVILNYASYLRKKDDVVLSGLTAASTNEVFEVSFGGLITIPAAFVYLGVGITAVVGSSFALGFMTLPVVFEQMGDIGRLFGFLFFFLLFLAAVTSSISMFQPVKAFLEESLDITPRRSTTIFTIVALAGSLFIIYFSKDLKALDTIDFWVGTFAIFLLATLQSVAYAWVFGVDRGFEEAHHGALMRIPRVFRFITKYVTPLYLLVVLGMFAWVNLPDYVKVLTKDKVALASVGVILVLLALLLWVVRQGEKRWKAKGLDLDGERVPDDELPATGGNR
jgi:neurotransmitter:Na+ symporter, NSS family